MNLKEHGAVGIKPVAWIYTSAKITKGLGIDHRLEASIVKIFHER